jgi:glycosyltransferase involved in cell wall biosynthesis
MSKPKISVVIGARNEYPIILSTIYSLYEELEYWGYPFEFVIVDNMSTDSTAAILRDKFRRWIKCGLLKVIEFNDKPANVLVRNIGARAATGEILLIADAHLSIKIGTAHLMIQGVQKHGGLWHTSTNIWGDTTNIRCRGYALKLEEKFWGNLSRGVPQGAYGDPDPECPDPLRVKNGSGKELLPYTVPMASHCFLAVGKEEYLDFGGYNEDFKCYGGGEPYLDLKWWLFGSKAWIEPRGLARHAFGINTHWRKVGGRKDFRAPVKIRDGGFKKRPNSVDEFLHYSRGYGWNNEQVHHNFLLSAYAIGGYDWLQKIYQRYWTIRKINNRYIEDLKRIRAEVLKTGQSDREFIQSRQKLSLDELLEQSPWLT